jgi:hypothetical protein
MAFVALLLVSSAAVAEDTLPLPELEPALTEELSQYILGHYQAPEDYILSKFEDHDIVFVGEYHRIKQNVELIQDLVPRLHEIGVNNLGMESACHADQGVIDSLITADTYDQAVANRTLFNMLMVWGYQEYADIFKAAWSVNHQLPEGAPRFRVVGLNTKCDWSHAKTEEDTQNPEVMRKVLPQGEFDEVMGRSVLKEFVEKGQKALVFSGSHHAFTQYKQPIYDEKAKKFVGFVEGRMGNRVYDVIGKRAITVELHSPWINEKGYSELEVYPVDGVIDALMPMLPGKYRSVGFDTKGTPFGSLPATTALYKHGYDDFKLADFCDGYVYQCAISEYDGVTPIEGFINAGNLAGAKAQSPNLRVRDSSVTADILNQKIAEAADIKRMFRRFQ